MDKLSFPKGSLSFRRKDNPEKPTEHSDQWKTVLKEYVSRKQFINVINEQYPSIKELDGEVKRINNMPKEIESSFSKTVQGVREARAMFKNLPSFGTVSNYEITFRHPKWRHLKFKNKDREICVGEIVTDSERMNVNDSLKQIMKIFRERKNMYRQFRTKSKTVKIKSLKSEIKYNMSGGIIYMPQIKEGVYIKFLKEQEKQIVYTHKSPKDDNIYLGVELEFMCDAKQDKLGLMLFEAGIGKQVTLTEDGSLRCCEERSPSRCETHQNKHLHELNVLVRENDYKDVLKKVCDVLAKTNAVVNKSCGMHVHLDMRTRDAEKAYQNLVSSQNILLKMNPKSRSEKYARKISERDLNVAKSSGERYYAINAMALSKHKTIEIRVHSGTVDFTKITNWIALLVKIANNKERVVRNFVSLKSFGQVFQIEDTLMSYIKERILKFKPKDDMIPEAERGVA